MTAPRAFDSERSGLERGCLKQILIAIAVFFVVFIGCAGPGETVIRRHEFPGDRPTVRAWSVVAALRELLALGDKAGIARYGWSLLPMDEARASCAIDISGRPFTLFEGDLPAGSTGGFEHELTEEFFRALANSAKLTLHLRIEAGSNAHHMIEAAFKAFARALRAAVAIDPSESGVPSTKGTLTG